MTIEAMAAQGMYQKDIAQALNIDAKTVSRALARGSAPESERPERGSKLDPYRAKVDELLRCGVWNASVILREIQADGYDGGSTVLRNYIQPKRAMRPGRATVRYETGPGKQLQTDWGALHTEVSGHAEPHRGALQREHAGLFAAVPLLVHGQRRCGTYL